MLAVPFKLHSLAHAILEIAGSAPSTNRHYACDSRLASAWTKAVLQAHTARATSTWYMRLPSEVHTTLKASGVAQPRRCHLLISCGETRGNVVTQMLV